ncbi:hypothetical protein ASG95_18560 [Phycicoccus sp. Soil803]|nr:hypothetical protein ASG95_18560 [Phycicoccus sp. Soil803]
MATVGTVKLTVFPESTVSVLVALPTTVEVLTEATATSTVYLADFFVELTTLPLADQTPVLAASHVNPWRSDRAPTASALAAFLPESLPESLAEPVAEDEGLG